MILTIDGPAGVGKSTVAKTLATTLGWTHVNSGLFYRKAGQFFTGNLSLLTEVVGNYLEANSRFLPGILSEDAGLKTTDAGKVASLVSAYAPLRDLINRFLQGYAVGRNMVVEGRDMATEAFPNAELQVFLDADLEERARRRWREEGGDLGLISRMIQERDAWDKNKAVGALRVAPGSFVVDCTYLTIDEVCEKVLTKLRTLIGQGDMGYVG